MSEAGEVAAHYRRDGLAGAILDALAGAGLDLGRLRIADLAGGDEFHFGRRAATEAFADHLDFSGGARILDIGCGVGGPARHFAAERGCRVVGLDATWDYVAAGAALTRLLGLADRVCFCHASALAAPMALSTARSCCMSA